MKNSSTPSLIEVVVVGGLLYLGCKAIQEASVRAENAEARIAEEIRRRKVAEQEAREASQRENTAHQRALTAENKLRENEAKKTETQPSVSRKPKGKPSAPRKTEFPVQ